MNVSIKTPFAEMSFEMSPDRAKNLIRVAVQLASSEDEAPHPLGMKYADPPEEPRPEPEPQKPTRSRVETMFGARETWSTPAAPGRRAEEPVRGLREGEGVQLQVPPDLPQVRLRPPHRSPRPEAGPPLLQVREQVQVHDQHQRSPVHDELSGLRRPR